MLGFGILKDFCKTLTDKPVKLVNTHAHWDHIGGNIHFASCYIHHREIPLLQEAVGYTKEQFFAVAKQMVLPEYNELLKLDENFADAKPMQVYPLYDGDVFDMGDRKIEVMEVVGHTPGSIVLIDPKTRIAYAGDACNTNTLLEFPHSLPVASYMKSLLKFQKRKGDFDKLYCGHEVLEPSIIDEGIETVARVIAGTDDRYEAIGFRDSRIRRTLSPMRFFSDISYLFYDLLHLYTILYRIFSIYATPTVFLKSRMMYRYTVCPDIALLKIPKTGNYTG